MDKFVNWLFVFLLSVSISFSGYRFYQQYNEPQDDMSKIIAATVQIENYCSGTIINDPDLSDGEQFTVITAKHCLDEGKGIGTILTVNIAEDISNKFTKMRGIKTMVTNISEFSDIFTLQALKAGEGLELPKINIYNGTVSIGDRAVSVSYPHALSKLITDGYLGYLFQLPAFSSVSKEYYYQLTTVTVAGGSSGSGLFKLTDNGYELIGVLTGGREFISAYTPIDEIRSFLKGI